MQEEITYLKQDTQKVIENMKAGDLELHRKIDLLMENEEAAEAKRQQEEAASQEAEKKQKEDSTLKDMLAKRPEGAGQKALVNWDKVKSLIPGLFLKGWQQFNANTPLPDLQTAPYFEEGVFSGQRNANKQLHGIVREVQPNGEIRESTYKNGKKEGLAINYYTDSQIRFTLYQNDS